MSRKASRWICSDQTGLYCAKNCDFCQKDSCTCQRIDPSSYVQRGVLMPPGFLFGLLPRPCSPKKNDVNWQAICIGCGQKSSLMDGQRKLDRWWSMHSQCHPDYWKCPILTFKRADLFGRPDHDLAPALSQQDAHASTDAHLTPGSVETNQSQANGHQAPGANPQASSAASQNSAKRSTDLSQPTNQQPHVPPTQSQATRLGRLKRMQATGLQVDLSSHQHDSSTAKGSSAQAQGEQAQGQAAQGEEGQGDKTHVPVLSPQVASCDTEAIKLKLHPIWLPTGLTMHSKPLWLSMARGPMLPLLRRRQKTAVCALKSRNAQARPRK